MTSIQSGMGIGEPASQGRLFPDPQATQSTPNPLETHLRERQERKKEIEGGQLEMTEDGPACEIADETCWGEVGQPVGHDLWFCEEHR